MNCAHIERVDMPAVQGRTAPGCNDSWAGVADFGTVRKQRTKARGCTGGGR